MNDHPMHQNKSVVCCDETFLRLLNDTVRFTVESTVGTPYIVFDTTKLHEKSNENMQWFMFDYAFNHIATRTNQSILCRTGFSVYGKIHKKYIYLNGDKKSNYDLLRSWHKNLLETGLDYKNNVSLQACVSFMIDCSRKICQQLINLNLIEGPWNNL